MLRPFTSRLPQILLLILLATTTVRAQELVTNGSFERTSGCPLLNNMHIAYRPAYTGFPLVNDWVAPGTTMHTAWYHECGDIHNSVPANACGMQSARTGRAYACFLTYWQNYQGPPTNPLFHKGLITTRLSEPMKKDSNYCVRFYVSPSFSGYAWSGGIFPATLHSIGANLSVAMPNFGTTPAASISMRSDIRNDTTQLLIDDTIWYEISGFFKAKGGERWLTLGYLDAALPKTFDTSLWYVANGTYIDDVSVLPLVTNRHLIVNCDSALDGSTRLQSSSVGAVYKWNTGDTGSSIRVYRPGKYRCVAYNDSVYTIDSFSVLPESYSSVVSQRACDSIGVPLKLSSPLVNAAYAWNTGQTWHEINPPQPGLYICNASNACAVRTDSFLVTADTVSALHRLPVCIGQTVNLNLRVPHSSPFYSWSTGAASAQIRVSDLGIYVCKSFDMCHFSTDSFQVVREVVQPPQVSDTSFCQFAAAPVFFPGDSSIIWYESAGAFLWTATQPGINMNEPARTRLFAARKVGACLSERVPLNVHVLISPQARAADTLNICDAQVMNLPVGRNEGYEQSYRWSNGDSTYSIIPNEIGEYIRQRFNICGSATDTFRIVDQSCDRCIFFPTAFTPNGDGRNDGFGATLRCPFTKFSLSVYNRWGQRVYVTNDVNAPWNGMHDGLPAPLGVYMYYSTMYHAGSDWKVSRKGDVTLIR